MNIQRFNEHQEEYLDEVNKKNILDDLDRVVKHASGLHKIINNSNHLDNETKQNILELLDLSKKVFNLEADKELKRQKESGKQFLSDNEIDDIVDKAKN
jgi:hypothetical protein